MEVRIMSVTLWKYGSALSPFPEALSDAERALIKQRRIKAKVGEELPPVGLAISGGGIRSATFGLGVLQALAKADILKHVDYLSTVSGGGYIGAFLGCLFQREEEPQCVSNKLMDRNSSPIKWLRDNGRYLAPNGAGDVLVGLAVAVRNFLSVHFVMALLMMPLALLLVCAARISPEICGLQVPLLWGVAALPVLVFAILTMLYWLVMTVPHVMCCLDFDKVDKWRRNLTTIMGYLLLSLAAILFLGVLLRLSKELLSCDLKGIHNIGLVGVIALVLGGGPKVVRKIRDMSEKVMGLGLQVAGSIVGFTVFTLYVFIWIVAAQALIPNADGNVHLACLSPCMACCLGCFIFISCFVALLLLAKWSAVPIKQSKIAEATLGFGGHRKSLKC
ncbi:MAG: hypothetical protein EOM66_10725 [Clostridia bacterium]|nr:hypothetical protein [Clostridia bacterium]